MKNRFFLGFLLIFCLVMLFAACGKTESADNDTEAVIQNEQTEINNDIEVNAPDTETAGNNVYGNELFPANEEPVSISFLKDEVDYYDESGKILLLSGQFVYPVISLPQAPEAEAAIRSYFENEKDKYLAEAEHMLENSKELLANTETDYWNTFIINKEYRLKMVDSQYISFLCHSDFYLGGPHPSPDESGVTFELSSGKVMTLSDLFGDVDALRQYAVAFIESKIDKNELLPDAEEFIPTLVDEGTLFPDRQGITFICNVYVLFPYASGIKYYTIPYAEIEKYLAVPINGGKSFSRFYTFDIDGEDDVSVLGYLDCREALCPYDEIETVTLEGDSSHVCHIIPKYMGSLVTVDRVIYDENGVEAGTEQICCFENTAEDFCLKIIGPIIEGAPAYRVTILDATGRKASIDIVYRADMEKPVKLIK